MKAVFFTITLVGIFIILGALVQKQISMQWIEECDKKFGKGNWTFLPKKVVGMSIVYECVESGREFEFCLNISDLPSECLKIWRWWNGTGGHS